MRSITRLIVCASGVLLTLWPPYGKECRYLRSWRSQKPKFGVSIVSIGCRFFEGQLAVTIYRFRKTPVSTVPYYGDFPVGDYETLSGEELSSPAPNAWRYSKDILPPGLIFIRDAAEHMRCRHSLLWLTILVGGWWQFGCAPQNHAGRILASRERLERCLNSGMTVDQIEAAICPIFLPLTEVSAYQDRMVRHYLVCWSPVDQDEAIILQFDVGYRLMRWSFKPRETYPYFREREIEKQKADCLPCDEKHYAGKRDTQ